MSDPFYNPFPIDGVPVCVDSRVSGTDRALKSGREYLVSREWLDKAKSATPEELTALVEGTEVLVIDEGVPQPPLKFHIHTQAAVDAENH